jgi:hypothetical protein
LKAYEREAGENAQVAQITRQKVADEQIAGADRFVVAKTLRESGEERRNLTSQENQLKQPLEKGGRI